MSFSISQSRSTSLSFKEAHHKLNESVLVFLPRGYVTLIFSRSSNAPTFLVRGQHSKQPESIKSTTTTTVVLPEPGCNALLPLDCS